VKPMIAVNGSGHREANILAASLPLSILLTIRIVPGLIFSTANLF
jgi:hypothetical protein